MNGRLLVHLVLIDGTSLRFWKFEFKYGANREKHFWKAMLYYQQSMAYMKGIPMANGVCWCCGVMLGYDE